MDTLEPIPQTEPYEDAPPPSPLSGENPVWNLLDVLLIAGVTVVALFFSTLALVTATLVSHHSLNLAPADLAKNIPLLVGIQTLAYLAVMGFMWIIVRMKHDRAFLQAISWNMPRPGRVVLLLLAGALLAAFSEGASLLLSRWIPKSLPMDDFFRTQTSAYTIMFFGILIAPPAEELFFRGFLYPALARPLGMTFSVVLTAAGFALLHAGQLALAWAPLLIIFIVGAVLTLVRARTKSVATTIILHMGYNATIFTAVLISTHGFRHLDKP
ncbi:MAG TPA: CPBP family intramembrane glutamic endopeptidase [Candidatus Saccharimonadales bacterium]|nr:CPBP family intramembrane glutamic endopeptidase [Candidatus Saccharimonadales bacterium]